mgnify:CR=1 FL=1
MEAKPTPSSLRKYPYEYAILSLTAAVIYLFFQYTTLNSYIRESMTNQMKENTEVMTQIKQLLITQKN